MAKRPIHLSRSMFHSALTAIIVMAAITWTSGLLADDSDSDSTGNSSCASVFQHEMRKLHSSQQIDICQLVGNKPALIINTASHCGYTQQFKGLEALHQRFKDQGLVVIGFASNDFNQEAKDEAKAADICYINYGVSFTMLAPSAVKGEQANPVFKVLAQHSKAPKWNFNKYLVSKDGAMVEHFGSSVKPGDAKLTQAIELAL